MPKKSNGGPLADWEDMSRNLQARLESWNKSSQAARDDAERARSRAEADRNAAQEARDHALMQLVQETGRRATAEESAQHLEAERAALVEDLASQRTAVSHLQKSLAESQTSHAADCEALQLADAERRSLRRDLDAAAKDVVAMRRDCEKSSATAGDLRRQLDDLRSELSSARETARAEAARAAEGERKAAALAEEARRSVATLRSGVLLQEGLRAKAEIGMQEAAKELSFAHDAALAVSVERRLLQDRVQALMQERDALVIEKQVLEEDLDALRAHGAVTDAGLTSKLKEENQHLLAQVEAISARLEEADAARSALESALESEKDSTVVMRRALDEATSAKKELRAAWHASEDALHEMSRARSEAEAAKHRMTEALVRERAARVMAQQELERAAEGDDNADRVQGVDKTRLALWHEEMNAEKKSLDLILDALREMRQSTENAPGTPERE